MHTHSMKVIPRNFLENTWKQFTPLCLIDVLGSVRRKGPTRKVHFLLPTLRYRSILTYLHQTTFKKYCDIWEKLIPILSFSLQRVIPHFLFNAFKLIFCRFVCMWGRVNNRSMVATIQGPLTLSLKQTLFDASAADSYFRKHSDKRRDCSKRAISSFDTMFSTFSHRLYISIKLEIFYFLTKYVQSRLLQNCCMRKRVHFDIFAADNFEINVAKEEIAEHEMISILFSN